MTGCELPDLVEAAHIRPFRGSNDHHVENGLLLRADLHTLFDLDLIGVQPENLRVKVHPVAKNAGYDVFDGKTLLCAEERPSALALESRWSEFLHMLRSRVA